MNSLKSMIKTKSQKSSVQKINQATIERYNRRLELKGAGAFALGWGKKHFQIKRFDDLLHAVGAERLKNKTILDIGCGFGDLYDFFKNKKITIKKYIGTDINENFIRVAKTSIPQGRFIVRDLMLEPFQKPIADVGIALGVINFKQENHEEYAFSFIEKSFAAVSDFLVINVISDVHNENYPRENFIYYYKPSKWLELAQKLTPFCSLIHDYEAEPQYEFMLILYKKPWKKK